jgi:hypothetical protein
MSQSFHDNFNTGKDTALTVKKKLASVLAGLAIATGFVAIEATPAAASYPCGAPWSCYFNLDPYVYGTGSNMWKAPTCGTHDLWAVNFHDRISYAANWGNGGATLDNWTGTYYNPVATINPGTGARNLVGTFADNVADRVRIVC